MRKRSPSLHGNAPDRASVAVLVIDVINDFGFPSGEQLERRARPMARPLAALLQRARRAAVPVIYVNDNFGRWRSNFPSLVEHCAASRGAFLTSLLRPEPDDYFVLKLKHSGFYASPLDLLLQSLGVETVILTGVTAESCVFFTACDAYLRDLRIVVASDCVASADPRRKRAALEHLRTVLGTSIRVSTRVALPARRRTRRRGRDRSKA